MELPLHQTYLGYLRNHQKLPYLLGRGFMGLVADSDLR